MQHRETAQIWSREHSRSKRDIGEIPPITDRSRRGRSYDSLEFFCKTYQPEIYYWPFSPAHLEVIGCLETAIRSGGLFCYAMPRASGKTSLTESAALWAILGGYRQYVLILAATEGLAKAILGNLKTIMETNDLLLADWPETLYPIRCLEGIAHRTGGQLYRGEPTRMVWKGEQLILPTIPDSKTSGSALEIRGITGAVRGKKLATASGGALRPDFIILDDPQTDESALSLDQCNKREKLILGAVLGLGSHGKPVATVMPCTVIHRDDLSERFLSSDKHPEWVHRRFSLLSSMPSNTKLWEQYADLFRQDPAVARDFYLSMQTEMDTGAEALWEDCKGPEHQSAIQYAMELKLRVGEYAFAAEYQNNPLLDALLDEMLSIPAICRKTTSYGRGIPAPEAQHVTTFIDVHKALLYYTVIAWQENFSGWVIDYGTYPEIKRPKFTLREVVRGLQEQHPRLGDDGAIYAGLKALVSRILDREWSPGLFTGLCLVDANWKTNLVKSFCRELGRQTTLMPSHGRFIGARNKPMIEYRKGSGDRYGLNWRIPSAKAVSFGRYVLFDSNYWKSFLHSRLLTPPGDRGCLQLFNSKYHEMFAEHLTAQVPKQVDYGGRIVVEWVSKLMDDHFLDCAAGCCVAASVIGCRLIDLKATRMKSQKRVKYLDL